MTASGTRDSSFEADTDTQCAGARSSLGLTCTARSRSFRATIKGLKIKDGEYSANPIDIARFLIEDEKFGLGAEIEESGFVAAAARNEETLGGRKRRECGILLDTPQPVEAWIQALAFYGGRVGSFASLSAGRVLLSSR